MEYDNENKKENENEKEKLLEKALETLKNYAAELSERAGLGQAYGEELWERMRLSGGVLREFSYYHDYGKLLGEYKVAGYTLADIVVWQVDHFKAYMDRHEEMNRYRQERLLLSALDVMLKMEKEPGPYIQKMQEETGTDRQNP